MENALEYSRYISNLPRSNRKSRHLVLCRVKRSLIHLTLRFFPTKRKHGTTDRVNRVAEMPQIFDKYPRFGLSEVKEKIELYV